MLEASSAVPTIPGCRRRMNSIEYLRTLTPKNSPQKYIVKEPAVRPSIQIVGIGFVCLMCPGVSAFVGTFKIRTFQSDTGTMGTEEEEEEELDKETVGRKVRNRCRQTITSLRRPLRTCPLRSCTSTERYSPTSTGGALY
jgi:hypothetical protein